MRMSVDMDDPGYVNLDYKVLVHLDGVLQEAVITADEEAGFVYRYKRDGAGNFYPEGDETATETVCGRVQITQNQP